MIKNRIRSRHQARELPGWYFKNSADWKMRKTLFESLPNEPDEILFVGNSLTDGCEWHELFGNQKVKNRGIDGDNTEGVISRLDELTSSLPAKIFLEIGTNDLALKRTIIDITKDYSTILDQIKKASPKTLIYLQSVLPRFDDPNRIGGVSNDSIRTLNRELQILANQKGVIFIDLYVDFVDSDEKLHKNLSLDGVHLNAEGYTIWKNRIECLVNDKRP